MQKAIRPHSGRLYRVMRYDRVVQVFERNEIAFARKRGRVDFLDVRALVEAFVETYSDPVLAFKPTHLGGAA